MALRDGDWKLLASRDFNHLELYNLEGRPARDDGPRGEGARRFQAMRRRLELLNSEVEHEGPDWWKRLSPNGGGPLRK